MELGQMGKGKSISCFFHLRVNVDNDKKRFFFYSYFFRRLILNVYFLFSVLTSVNAIVKLYVKIIVVKVVISVLLKWSRINPKLVVTLNGELCGNQYEFFILKYFSIS